jgi:hypothetical protein
LDGAVPPNRTVWSGKTEVVRILRTIMAVLLAVAVAAMPAAAGVMAAAEMKADASAGMAHAGDMPADCAHHHAPAPGDQGQKGGDDGAAMAACAVHCFTYVGTIVPGIAVVPTSSRLAPLASTDQIASDRAAPPFRPPRI